MAAELDVAVDALPDALLEPLLLALVEVALPEDAEPEVADAVRVTPAASQDCWAKDSAAEMSEEEQVDWMQEVTLLTKDWSLQRQAVSEDEQEPVLPLWMHVKAQATQEKALS